MSRKEKIIIGGAVWVGVCFIFGTYSSFIPNVFMEDGVQVYVPYCFAACWIIFMSRWDKKKRVFFFQIRSKDLLEKKKPLGHPIIFYPFVFVIGPIFFVWITWFILFTQTNVWGQITSWQHGIEQVEIERFKKGRSKRAIGTTTFWVKDQGGERYRVIIKDRNLHAARGIKVDEVAYAELEVRKGPLGRFVNKVTLLPEQMINKQ